MGFFGKLLGGVVGLIGGGNKRKAAEAEARRQAEIVRQKELENQRLRDIQSMQATISDKQSQNSMKWMPFALGGGGLLLTLIIFLTTGKRR